MKKNLTNITETLMDELIESLHDPLFKMCNNNGLMTRNRNLAAENSYIYVLTKTGSLICNQFNVLIASLENVREVINMYEKESN